MQIVGLTGGIGAGKSTAAAMLARRGAHVVDVDSLGRAVIAPGGRGERAVLDRFGPEVADPAGSIDRTALARRVFADPAELAALEAISHPAINAELDERLDRIAAVAPTAVVVFDQAVLVGSKLGRDLPSGRGYGEVVVVEAAEAVRIERLTSGREMSVDDARARIAAQPTDDARRAIADHLLVNDGDLELLEQSVARLAGRLGLDGSIVVGAAALPGTEWIASRRIVREHGPAWDGIVVGEWELRAGWFADTHPHDELNHVLDGELHVTTAGRTHVVAPGATILVPAGQQALYAAPEHARMLFVYGPNPRGIADRRSPGRPVAQLRLIIGRHP